MLFRDDGYSTFVTWSKVILPVLALALLSSLFLVSGRVDVTKSVPYAELNVDQIIKDQRISSPLFTGVSETGTQVLIIAAYARPDQVNTDLTYIANPTATLVSADETTTRIMAQNGLIDDGQSYAFLRGAVDINTSSGYSLETDALKADMANSGFETLAPVAGNTPFGPFTAGKMILQQSAQGQQILFKDGVHLLYDPKR